MNPYVIVRRTATAVAGALVVLVGSAVVVGLPAAQAVPPRALAPAASIATVPTGQVVQDEGPTTALVTAEFVQELEAAGLVLSEGGNRIWSRDAGLGTPQQLVLAQMAADRFGIVKNPFFDPKRVAVVREGTAVADLSTGVILGYRGSAAFGTTEVIASDLLEQLRARAGWTITSAREAESARVAAMSGGYIPVYLQSDEAYARYKEAARANYTALANA